MYTYAHLALLFNSSQDNPYDDKTAFHGAMQVLLLLQ